MKIRRKQLATYFHREDLEVFTENATAAKNFISKYVRIFNTFQVS